MSETDVGGIAIEVETSSHFFTLVIWKNVV